MMSLDRMAVYLSGSKTGSGSAQTYKHGLGCIPGFVLVQTDTVSTVVTLGTMTAENVVVTVDNAVTYKIAAFALAN